MRCRDVDGLWDEVRGECQESLKEAVDTHLYACPDCQELYQEYEGVAYCLSSLPAPMPSCDLANKVVEHIALIKRTERTTPVVLTSVQTPIGRLYVGFKEEKIAYIGIDTGLAPEEVRARVERRLRRPVNSGEAPVWLQRTLEQYFSTWRVDDGMIDIEDLTPFEQAALRAAAQIPPGEVRSYSWVASQIGRPRAALASPAHDDEPLAESIGDWPTKRTRSTAETRREPMTGFEPVTSSLPRTCSAY